MRFEYEIPNATGEHGHFVSGFGTVMSRSTF